MQHGFKLHAVDRRHRVRDPADDAGEPVSIDRAGVRRDPCFLPFLRKLALALFGFPGRKEQRAPVLHAEGQTVLCKLHSHSRCREEGLQNLLRLVFSVQDPEFRLSCPAPRLRALVETLQHGAEFQTLHLFIGFRRVKISDGHVLQGDVNRHVGPDGRQPL